MFKGIRRYTLIMLWVAGSLLPAGAQTEQEASEESEASRNLFLECVEQQEAIVSFDIPEDILTNLGKNPGTLVRPGTEPKKQPGNASLKKLQGYRIQVFSDGRNPSTLQSRAKARGNAIVSRFPKYRGQVYTSSASPNWYTRVGNFKTQQEAAEAMAELKRAFPSFAGEMRVVKSPITIIK